MAKSKISSKRRFWVALLIIVPAFAIITGMLLIHAHTNQVYLQQIQTGDFTDTNKQNFKDMVDAVDKSNQTLFNILLPVLAAWVGTVIAFYFGTESLDRAQRINETLTLIAAGKTENITLRDLLNLYPDSKNVKQISFNDKLSDVITATESFGNAVIVEDDGVKGVIYYADIRNIDDQYKSKNLGEVIKQVKIKDHITDEEWTDKGIVNFAELEYDNTLTVAKDRLESVKAGHHDVLGLILDKDKKPEAAISFHTLAKNLGSK